MLRAAIVLLLAVPPLWSQDIVMSGWFWSERTPVIPREVVVDRDTAVRRVLEEARHVFSAMLYGYSFDFTPSDASRGVREEFAIGLNDEIAAGDAALEVLQVLDDGRRLDVHLRYGLRDFQRVVHEAWRSSALPSAAARGEASFLDGPPARIAAVQAAVKTAVREWVRGRVADRPRQIRGRAVLTDAPRIVILEGKYVASVRIRLRIERIRPYEVF